MFESERRDLAWVPRWSILRVNRRQSVAEHCYFVCCYGLEIARLTKWDGDALELAVYLLRHDDSEVVTGDIPGPAKVAMNVSREWEEERAKARFGEPPRATDAMAVIRKCADLLDECMYLAGEIKSGNVSVMGVLYESKRRMAKWVRSIDWADDSCVLDLYELMTKAVEMESLQEKNLEGLSGT